MWSKLFGKLTGTGAQPVPRDLRFTLALREYLGVPAGLMPSTCSVYTLHSAFLEFGFFHPHGCCAIKIICLSHNRQFISYHDTRTPLPTSGSPSVAWHLPAPTCGGYQVPTLGPPPFSWLRCSSGSVRSLCIHKCSVSAAPWDPNRIPRPTLTIGRPSLCCPTPGLVPNSHPLYLCLLPLCPRRYVCFSCLGQGSGCCPASQVKRPVSQQPHPTVFLGLPVPHLDSVESVRGSLGDSVPEPLSTPLCWGHSA